MTYEYKRNGAGDVFRKHGTKVECFYRGAWGPSILRGVWDLDVMKPISEEVATRLTSKEHMAILLESPPYMPINEDEREIWTILNALGYYHVKLIKYEKHIQVVFTHKPWLKSEGSNVEKAEVLDLRWAFRHLEGAALPLVKKVFADLQKEKV